MQKIPVWYGPDFFPDKRVNGGDSKYVIGDGHRDLPVPDDLRPSSRAPRVRLTRSWSSQDRPEVRAFAEFLATPEGLKNWIVGKGVLSPNVKTPAEWYANNYKLKVANDIASSATAIGFDASDLMPPSVGAGSFWTEHRRLGQQQRHEHRCRVAGHRRQLAQRVSGQSASNPRIAAGRLTER